MLELKDLKNRIYKEKQVVGFEYTLESEDGKDDVRFRFDKLDALHWKLQTVMDRQPIGSGDQVYTIPFELPKENVDLAMVAAVGLYLFKALLMQEVQKKSDMNFALGCILEGMVHG